MTGVPLLSVESLQVSFAAGKGPPVYAVNDVSFRIAPGECVALVGESGSGKSVTATSILRLLPRTAQIAPHSALRFAGRDLLSLAPPALRALRGRDISMVFQDPMSSLNPVFTVGEQLAESLQRHLRLSHGHAMARAVELLQEVGIARPELRVRSYPHELSGGQQQRVMIALAIACQPKLLIADEPTTALDVTVQQQILALLLRLRERQGMALLFITHDLTLVRAVADHVVVMQHGEVREQNRTQALFNAPQHPYTRALMACRPRLDSRPRRLPVVEDFLTGEAPPTSPPRRRGTSPDDAVALEVRHLSKHFTLKAGLLRRQRLPVLHDVSFKLPRGKTLGIVGESGSGKSTTALTLLRLIPNDGGQVWFDGRDLLTLSPAQMLAYRRRIQIVFQNPFASLNPRFTVAQLLLEPLTLHRIGASDGERVALAEAMLQRVGLPAAALARYPHEFSGGQRQRIAIARCLVVQPEVLILDEAVSALDVSVQAQVLNLLTELQDEFGLSYLFISHDLAVVKHISDRVLVMQQGRVVEMADADDLYRAPQTDYTRALLAAIPDR